MPGVLTLRCYEDLIAGCAERFEWPQFDERTAAALCYTSGTTGDPRGALYSHRSIILNALSCCLPGVFSLSARDTILAVVPMFHCQRLVHSLCRAHRRRQTHPAGTALGRRRSV